MSAKTTIETLTVPSDPRGFVLEPLDEHQFPHQRNAHLVLTKPGAIRGNHYHRVGTEVAVVLGPALVRIREDEGLVDHEIPAGQAWRFTFPPGLPHAMIGHGPDPMIILSFVTVPHDPSHPDVVRDILIEPPPA